MSSSLAWDISEYKIFWASRCYLWYLNIESQFSHYVDFLCIVMGYIYHQSPELNFTFKWYPEGRCGQCEGLEVREVDNNQWFPNHKMTLHNLLMYMIPDILPRDIFCKFKNVPNRQIDQHIVVRVLFQTLIWHICPRHYTQNIFQARFKHSLYFFSKLLI